MDSKPSSSFSISTKDNIKDSGTSKPETSLGPWSKIKYSSVEEIDNLTFDELKKTRLSGASKKRFVELLKQGSDYEVAKKAIIKENFQRATGASSLVKRPHPEENAQENQPWKKLKPVENESDQDTISSEEFLQAIEGVENNVAASRNFHSKEKIPDVVTSSSANRGTENIEMATSNPLSEEELSECESSEGPGTAEAHSSDLVTIPSSRIHQATKEGENSEASSGSVSTSNILSSIQIAVVLEGYPNEMMTEEKLGTVQSSITDAMIHPSQENSQLRFHKCVFRPGHLVFSCVDEETANWLKETVPTLKPWDGAVLKFLEGNQVPKPLSCTAFVPDERNGRRASADEVLRFLQIGNQVLNTHLWTICGCVPKKSGQLWIFLIDPKSLEELQNLDMHPFFALGRIRFHTKDAFHQCHCCALSFQ